MTLADRGEGGGEGRREKGESRLGELEVAEALEAAAKGLEACLEDCQEDEGGKAELIRGTAEVVKATNKLVVCLKERKAADVK